VATPARRPGWTQAALGAEEAGWLGGLQPLGERPGVELFHGSPRDPVWDYVLTEQVALISILETTATADPRRAQPHRAGARLGR